ncbi:hypothetical protein J3Q64DRAFT_1725395 [Phycomyces blakesleeanus]|uniref:ENTH domain-containing protein n=2 Tax=Phycomyces blakesleeanus TaxID=4837 RepID=A0ABR3B7T9_PHYBL
MSGKGVVRSIKNYAKGFSDVQIRVREATSNDSWGPSGTLMNEIAQMTYNQHDFVEIMDMIDRRLNDKGKNWRHVFKALLLLDYCLHVGSDNVVLYAKENVYVVKTLKEFQHIDDTGRDVGANVRQKAKEISNLLLDDARLREERRQRQQMRDRMIGVTDYMNETMLGTRNEDGEQVYTRPGYLDDDKELRKALEESKRLADAEARNRNQGDEDLAKAISLSEQEALEKERKKREKLERENEQQLFGSGGISSQPTGFNPFPANQTFDSSSNPYAQTPQIQWPQSTGFNSMGFSDPIGSQQTMQTQNTGFSNQFSNPYQQQTNPYQSQGQSFGFGQGLQAQMTGVPQQSQFTGMAPFQTNTATSQQFGSSPSFQSSMVTGTQNPFGQQQPQNNLTQQSFFGSVTQEQASPSFANARSMTLPSMSTQNNNNNNNMGSSSPLSSRPTDPRFAKLNSLLANKDDGMDTFGNTGNLRVPYGAGYASTIRPEPTGQSNSTADLLNLGGDSGNKESSAFSQPFGQQPSRNPFGQSTSVNATGSPHLNNQKSLLEMMQEQRQQQQQQLQQQQQQLQQHQQFQQMTGMQPQMTGFNGSMGFNQQQQQQMTGVQPQMTGFNGSMGFNQQQQPQQQPFGQQSGSFF